MLSAPLLFLAESHNLVWYWDQCDQYAKIVVGILAVLSVVSISTMIQKGVDLRKWRRANMLYERVLDGRRLIDMIPSSGNRRNPQQTFYEIVVDNALRVLPKHRSGIEDEEDVRVCVSQIENAIQRAIARAVAAYEKGMGILSMCVSGGPFLGLLGTVLGVMVTFGALTEKATISELAPGVSGALVATTAGLILAIPALFAYNFLLSRVRRLSAELDNFASSVADQMETELLEELRTRRKEKAAAAPAPKAVPAEALRAAVPAPAAVPADNPFLRDESAPAAETGEPLPPPRSSWD